MSTVNEKMTSLADAVRAKSGVSGKLSIDAMTSAVNAIETVQGGDIDLTGVTVTADKLLDGVVAVNASGSKVTGNIKNVSLAVSGNTVTIAKGYTEGESVTVAGVDTSDADAEPFDVAPGKIFYSANGRQVGNMPESKLTLTVGFNSTDLEFYVFAGRTGGYVANTESGMPTYYPLSELGIRLQDGEEYTPTTYNQFIEPGCYIQDTQVIRGDANLVPENIVSGKTIFGVAGTAITGGGGGSGTGASFAKVTEFVAPYDAFTAVSSINVSGLGEVEVWGDMQDFSSWNGTYNVTAATFFEADINKRVFKHETQDKYLYQIYDDDWGESKWIFDTSEEEKYISGAEFYSSNLASGTWYNYNYEFSVSLTIDQVSTNYPAQPLILKAVTATYSESGWFFGTDETGFTSYDETPKVDYIYATTGKKLIGNPVSRDILYGGSSLLLSIPFAAETTVAETGQTLAASDNFSCEYVTFDGVPCINILEGHLNTVENSGIEGDISRTFSFWGYGTYYTSSYPCAIGCGNKKEPGKIFYCGAKYDHVQFVEKYQADFTNWGDEIDVDLPNGRDNKMHHYAFVFDKTDPKVLTIYVDGVKTVHKLSQTVNTARSPFYIGDSYENWYSNNQYSGYLAKVRCYNTALTANEVKQLFNDKK